jgi:hypothetical protein
VYCDFFKILQFKLLNQKYEMHKSTIISLRCNMGFYGKNVL